MEKLPLKYMINNKYRIEKYISESNFSNIYYVSEKNKGYIMKECFPKGFVIREKERVYSGKYRDKFKILLKSLEKEGEIIKNISSEETVKLKEYFQLNGTGYLIMEYCKGSILKNFVLENRLGYDEIFEIFSKLLDTIEKIHEKGVIHRDLKPSNIIIDIENNIKVIDFGSSIMKNEKNGEYIRVTPGYSPLEMYSLKTETDERSDIYSLCAILYFMINRKKPMEAVERFYFPEIFHENSINIKIKEIIKKGMAMEKNERYTDIGELKREIRELNGK